MSIILWLLLAVVVGAFVLIYNSLIQRKNQVEASWGAIDAYLKKRFDLIPNLVAIVRQYMEHERNTFEKVAKLREQAMAAPQGVEAQAALDQELTGALRSVMARAEAYPELRSNQNFVQLQQTLSDVEEQLSAARRAYNSSVRDFNDGVEMLPYNLVAALLGLRRKEMLATPEAEKAVPDVARMFAQK